MKVSRCFVMLCVVATGILNVAFAAEKTSPEKAATFSIGVAPHTSARVIVEMYQPLRRNLEKALGRPVDIVTAGDFNEYARRGMDQRYDLAITTGHQAQLFASDAGYLPLLTYQADFKAVVLVAVGSPVREPRDLDGSTVIGLSTASLVTIWGEHWLQRNNVANIKMRYVSASDSAVQLVLNGEGSAGMTSLANFHNLQPAVRARLRILDESLPLAGRVYLLNKRHAAIKDRVDAALWSFAETPEAKQYFDRYKLEGYRKLAAKELTEMAPYANEVRQVLKQGK